MQLRAPMNDAVFAKSSAVETLPAKRPEACKHCGTPLDASDAGPFCCTGCETVYGILTSEHLETYYDLRGERGQPARDAGTQRGAPLWLEPIEKSLAEAPTAQRIELDIQGLHCTACVWLIQNLAKRHDGAMSLVVDPSVGRLHLVAEKKLDLPALVADVERFGYRLGPPLKDTERKSNEIVFRMGITIALAMNAMIFAIASYAGLSEGPTFVLFERITFGISTLSVIVGGPVFFRSAFRALRAGVLHMDLPIALGIVLAYGGSLVSFLRGHSRGVFVDTLDVFIALMLVGRFLQERALERNRLALLASDGVEGLRTRRVEGDKVTTIRATELRRGDVVHVAPGEVLPVDAKLEGQGETSFSLDWVNGESEPHAYAVGATIPAGAFSASDVPQTLVSIQDFADSPLVDLLRTPEKRHGEEAQSLPFWDRLTRYYVAAVLVAAAVGFVGWYVATRDLARALEVTTAVLIVTCPCAFGIATPLAYDLVQSGLRRAGLFVRSAGFLDRAALVRTVVFDKTGTLTTGALTVRSRDLAPGCDADKLALLASLAGQSTHPKSMAVHDALVAEGVTPRALSGVREEVGRGVVVVEGSVEYRLGAPAWALSLGDSSDCGAADVVFTANGERLASFVTEEALRKDAKAEVDALGRDGTSVYLLSGDDPARVAQTARLAGIPEEKAVGGRTAEGKAAWVDAHDRKDLLMVGDGINDALVVARAFCGGTPAVDRPFMAARSDFYFTTPGLAPIRLALRSARELDRVRRRNLAIALAYNLLSVSLAYAGLLSPLACAVLMPLSSLTAILSTTLSLSPKAPLWKS